MAPRHQKDSDPVGSHSGGNLPRTAPDLTGEVRHFRLIAMETGGRRFRSLQETVAGLVAAAVEHTHRPLYLALGKAAELRATTAEATLRQVHASLKKSRRLGLMAGDTSHRWFCRARRSVARLAAVVHTAGLRRRPR